MKYFLFSGLESNQFKSLLTIARIIGTCAIVGFYLTLIIAGYRYFSFTTNDANFLDTASSVTNSILINGFLICGFAFVVSVSMAWFIAAKQNKSSEFVGQTL